MRLVDWEIEQANERYDMVSPFLSQSHLPSEGMSYGLAASGYDFRVGDVFLELGYGRGPNRHREVKADSYVLHPGAFIMVSTLEWLRMPQGMLAFVADRSTMARLGVGVFNTKIDPGFVGCPTIEVVNHGPLPVTLHARAGLAQLVFERCSVPRKPYVSDGKYAGHVAPVQSRLV
jgi:deoxycytidine triphosphate deaminase